MEASDQSVLHQKLRDIDQLQDGDGVFGSGLHPEREHNVLCRFERHLLPHHDSSGLLTLSSNRLESEGFPIQGVVFWLFHSTPGLHQSVFPDFKWAN